MPRARHGIGVEGVIAVAHLLFGIVLLALAFSPGGIASACLMLLAGSGWMMAMTTLNASAQLVLPSKMRARGLACYLTSFAAAMSAGSLIWGGIARSTNLPTSLAIAGITILVFAAIGHALKIGEPQSQPH
jgi:predicted MFS family arabinose efflux permease